METVNSIRNLISQGDIDKAILALVNAFQNHKLKDSVVSLSARYNLLAEKSTHGIIAHQDATLEENRITYSILKLLNEIEIIHTEATLVNVNQTLDDKSILKKLLEILNETHLGFSAQAKIRDRLYTKVKKRLAIEESLQYEEFFHEYYSRMNEEELAYHNSIRAYTVNVINKYNRKALELILGNYMLIEKIPRLKELERHLLVWLGKFERLFKNTPSFSLIYVGVDEENPMPRKKVEFPFGIEEELKGFLESEI